MREYKAGGASGAERGRCAEDLPLSAVRPIELERKMLQAWLERVGL